MATNNKTADQSALASLQDPANIVMPTAPTSGTTDTAAVKSAQDPAEAEHKQEITINSINAALVGQDEEIPDTPIVIADQYGNGMVYSDCISLIYGKAKSRKTTLANILTAVALGAEVEGIKRGNGRHEDGRPLEVVVVDTEQDRRSSQRIYDKVRQLRNLETNVPMSHIHVANILGISSSLGKGDEIPQVTDKALLEIYQAFTKGREQDETFDIVEVLNRYFVIKLLVDHFRPDLLVIDNIQDLLNDLNDQEGSKRLVEDILKMAQKYHMAVLGVMHSPASNEGTALGWIGKYMINKSASIIVTECAKNEDGTTDEDSSTISKSNSRFRFKQPAYEGICWGYTEDGEIYVERRTIEPTAAKPIKDSTQKRYDCVTRYLNDLPSKTAQLADIAARLVEWSKTAEDKPISPSTAKRFVLRMADNGKIVKVGTDKMSPYTLPIFPAASDNDSNELPF